MSVYRDLTCINFNKHTKNWENWGGGSDVKVFPIKSWIWKTVNHKACFKIAHVRLVIVSTCSGKIYKNYTGTCSWNNFIAWRLCVKTFVYFLSVSQRCHFIWCHPSLLPHPVTAGPRATHRWQCVLQIDQQYTAAHITATKQVNLEYPVQVNNYKLIHRPPLHPPSRWSLTMMTCWSEHLTREV